MRPGFSPPPPPSSPRGELAANARSTPSANSPRGEPCGPGLPAAARPRGGLLLIAILRAHCCRLRPSRRGGQRGEGLRVAEPQPRLDVVVHQAGHAAGVEAVAVEILVLRHE